MSVARRQRTLARPVSVTGFGYFSGRDIRVEFWPAAEHAGITFVRHDIGGAARIPADAALRIDQPRRTTLELNGIRVEMVEHVLAALAGMRIDNCEVWVDAAEMPGCDGSSKAFVEAIDAAGVVEQRSPVRQIVVGQSVRVGDDDSWIEAQPPRSAGLSISYELDYGEQTAIGRQLYALDLTPDSFRRELSACRTFIPQEAAESILAQGIGKRVTMQRPVGLRSARSDRKHAAISRRVCAAQIAGRGWRPGPYRLRSDRSRRGLSLRPSAQCRVGQAVVGADRRSPISVLKQ